MRLVPLLMKKNRCGRCLVSMLTIMALIVSSFVLPVHTLKSGAAESTSSYGLSNPTISNGVETTIKVTVQPKNQLNGESFP